MYTLFNGDINNKKTLKSRGREGKSWTMSKKHSSSRFGTGLAWWMWVAPWLVLVGGMEGVKGAPIPGPPDCTYQATGDRTCGIRQAVDEYLDSIASGDTGSYGPIADWNTSLVTDMSYLFFRKGSFNSDISKWNTSAVTTMERSKTDLLSFCIFLLSA